MSDRHVIMIALRTSELIITEVESIDQVPVEYDGAWKFITPGLLAVQRGEQGGLGFMLTGWIPNELLGNTEIYLMKSEMAAQMNPHPGVISYYTAWAETERDKIHSFGDEFTKQIKEIEKYHIKKYKKTKEFHEQHAANIVIDLFETETGLGDTSKSH